MLAAARFCRGEAVGYSSSQNDRARLTLGFDHSVCGDAG
jgi:hypothetical protein